MSNFAVLSMSFVQIYFLTSGEGVFQVRITVYNQSSINFMPLIKGWPKIVLTVAPIGRLQYYKIQQILEQLKKNNKFLNIFLCTFLFTQAQQIRENDYECCSAKTRGLGGIFYQIVKNSDILNRLAYVRRSATPGNYICYWIVRPL